MEGKEKYFKADYGLIHLNYLLRNNKLVYFLIRFFIGFLWGTYPVYHFIQNLNVPQGNYTKSINYIFISIIISFVYVSYNFIHKFYCILENQMYYHWDLLLLSRLFNEYLILNAILRVSSNINLILYDIEKEFIFENIKDKLISISSNLLFITIYLTIIHIIFQNRRFIGKFLYFLSLLCLFYDFKYSLKINKSLILFNCVSYTIFVLDYSYYKFKYKKKTLIFFLERGFELISIFAYIFIGLTFYIQSKLIKYGIYLFLISISELIGKKYVNFIVYPIEKKYFLYSNDGLEKYLKKVVVKKLTY